MGEVFGFLTPFHPLIFVKISKRKTDSGEGKRHRILETGKKSNGGSYGERRKKGSRRGKW